MNLFGHNPLGLFHHGAAAKQSVAKPDAAVAQVDPTEAALVDAEAGGQVSLSTLLAIGLPHLATIPNHAPVPAPNSPTAPPAEPSAQEIPIATPSANPPISEASKVVHALENFGLVFVADAEKGLAYAVKYAVPAAALVSVIFPAAAPEAATLADATGLIQTAVIEVEQKYAAAGIQNGTGSQKAATVLTLVSSAVTSLLKQAGVTADTTYIQNLVNIVVGILNVQAVPAGA